MDLNRELQSLDWNYLFTSFEGRISRLHFWIGAILAGVACALIAAVIGGILDFLSWYLGHFARTLVSLAFLYPQYALLVKRGHDRGRPDIIAQAFTGAVALMLVLSLIPLLGLLALPLSFVIGIAALALLIDYGVLPGVAGANQYGPDPLASRA